jgi:hypothetical protein
LNNIGNPKYKYNAEKYLRVLVAVTAKTPHSVVSIHQILSVRSSSVFAIPRSVFLISPFSGFTCVVNAPFFVLK